MHLNEHVLNTHIHMYEHTLIYSALRYNTYEIVNHTRHCLHLFLVYAYL